MPSFSRIELLPVLWALTVKSLSSRWAIQSLQHPQVGSFQTSTIGLAIAGAACANGVANSASRNRLRADALFRGCRFMM
jgi:hypothetical protein